MWRGASATPTPWAPSLAPGNAVAAAAAPVFLCRTHKRRPGQQMCVSLPRIKPTFVVSGSQDFTVKVWDLPADLAAAAGADVHHLTPRTTEKAHDKVHMHTRKERKKYKAISSSSVSLLHNQRPFNKQPALQQTQLCRAAVWRFIE